MGGCASVPVAPPALEVRAPPPSFLSSLSWRRAVKGFATEGPAPNVAPILKAILMAPSSFGIQPYKVYVVTDAAKKAALQGVCYNQAQVGQASHVLVFAAAKDPVAMGERYISTTQLDKHNAGCELIAFSARACPKWGRLFGYTHSSRCALQPHGGTPTAHTPRLF
jgi:nitroreductase